MKRKPQIAKFFLKRASIDQTRVKSNTFFLSSLGFFLLIFLGLTVHGQVRRRFHLTGRVGGATRVDARILRIGGFDQQNGVIAFLDHLFRLKIYFES